MKQKTRYVTLAEVKEILEKETEKRGELTYEQGMALQHAQQFASLSSKDASKFVDELSGIEQVNPSSAVLIVDMMPKTVDEVRAIFSRERFTLEETDAKKILDIVAKYR